MTPRPSRPGAALSLLLGAVLCSCDSGSSDPGIAPPTQPGPQPAPVVVRTSLPDALEQTVLQPVGVTIEPGTGTLYVFDAWQGLYRQEADGSFVREIEATALYLQALPISDFTDIAAMGGGRFAVTARNDGFLLDLTAGTIQQHFCYLPGFLPPPPPGMPPLQQHTDSVAWDEATRRILAQPVTLSGTTSMNSELGTFPETGGDGNDWHPMPTIDFLAGAMTVDPQGVIWLARGNELYQYDLATDQLTSIRTLEQFGVRLVAGMAMSASTLWVLDAETDELVEIPLVLL